MRIGKKAQEGAIERLSLITSIEPFCGGLANAPIGGTHPRREGEKIGNDAACATQPLLWTPVVGPDYLWPLELFPKRVSSPGDRDQGRIEDPHAAKFGYDVLRTIPDKLVELLL